MKDKYRVGRKIGLVILETETSKEVARATTEEMAKNICELLNHQNKVNNSVLYDVSCSCEWCGTEKENPNGLCVECGKFPSPSNYR